LRKKGLIIDLSISDTTNLSKFNHTSSNAFESFLVSMIEISSFRDLSAYPRSFVLSQLSSLGLLIFKPFKNLIRFSESDEGNAEKGVLLSPVVK